MIVEGLVDVQKISGDINLADIFTKALPRERFTMLRDMIMK